MEGPTPVSALLHAATMVTAGVYLIIRFSSIIEFSYLAKGLVILGGLSTVLFSSIVALTQYDIKKIIAYSTCSQLGLMFFACGLSAYDLALFHFFNHAFFKCLLFLLAGVIIHERGGEQDIRKMGDLAAHLPITFACFFIAICSLAGFPVFSGAFSKDLVLLHVNNLALSADSWFVKVFLFSSNFVIFLTTAYAVRLAYYTFLAPGAGGSGSHSAPEMPPRRLETICSEPAYAVVVFCLSGFSVLGG
jgi:NADH-quinone oxidoreductase subunit L